MGVYVATRNFTHQRAPHLRGWDVTEGDIFEIEDADLAEWQTEVDNGSIAESTLYSAGGTDVAVVDGGTGASTAAGARTNLDVQRKATFDVRDYGALCDDTADDTTAVQAAITACASAGGGTILVPGWCKITSPLTLASSVHPDTWQGGGIHFKGISTRDSGLRATHAGILLDATPNLAAFCSFEQMSLLGPGQASVGSICLDANIMPHLRLADVYIRGFETGAQAYDSTGWHWTNVRLWYCGTGIKLGYNCDAMHLGAEIRNCDLGVLLGWATGSYTGDSQYLSDIKFPAGSIIAYNTLGFRLADKEAAGVLFDGTYFEGNTKDGEIGVNGRSDFTGATGVKFVGATFSATTSPPRPVAIDVYGRPDIHFDGCATDGANRYTLFVEMKDINGGTCVIERSRIQAVTAALKVGSRTWNTTSRYNERIAWTGRHSDHIDTVNLPSSVPAKETRVYSGVNRVIEAWGRTQLNGTTITNEVQIADSNGVLRIGGITSAFIHATSVASLPTAGADYRGCLAFVAGGAGVADLVYWCRKNSSDTYEWQALA